MRSISSRLDSTDPAPNTIWIFTANDTEHLERRFLSRCKVLEFSSYGLAQRSPRISKRYGTPRAETGMRQTWSAWHRIAGTMCGIACCDSKSSLGRSELCAMITRVAIYARMSTVNHGQDVSMQTRELRQFAEARGWNVAGEYIDAGGSGAKDSRPELSRLMADAHTRRFDVLCVCRFDRFTRSVSHLLRAWASTLCQQVIIPKLRRLSMWFSVLAAEG
jgi:hypothetical protein